MSAILKYAILDSAILPKLQFRHSLFFLNSDVSHQKFYSLGFSLTAQQLNLTQTHSFWPQLDDGSHLEFCHLGFRHCHLGFRHLVIFSEIHSKTLSLLPDSKQLNLTQTHSFLPNLMMSAILKSAILDSATVILDSDTLLSSFRFTQKHSHSSPWIWLKLIQSDSNSFILT